ncbi:MAG: enoyl-CoA hydratase-related protein [Halioglobus sp.]|nr:enoyl-CoA hydratase-related protein [Halioglobus sp.]
MAGAADDHPLLRLRALRRTRGSTAARWAAAPTLQRMFPVQKVRYMYFTGEFIDAAEAYRLGAVERVVPLEQLLPAAREIAAKIAEKSPAMVQLAKEALTGIEDGGTRGQVPLGAGLHVRSLHHGRFP